MYASVNCTTIGSYGLLGTFLRQATGMIPGLRRAKESRR